VKVALSDVDKDGLGAFSRFSTSWKTHGHHRNKICSKRLMSGRNLQAARRDICVTRKISRRFCATQPYTANHPSPFRARTPSPEPSSKYCHVHVHNQCYHYLLYVTPGSSHHNCRARNSDNSYHELADSDICYQSSKNNDSNNHDPHRDGGSNNLGAQDILSQVDSNKGLSKGA
jgi:hypothetical protein